METIDESPRSQLVTPIETYPVRPNANAFMKRSAKKKLYLIFEDIGLSMHKSKEARTIIGVVTFQFIVSS